MSKILHHPLEENQPLDKVIKILIETRSDHNILYYDPNYRCLTCGQIGEDNAICFSPYHQVKENPRHQLAVLLEKYPTELLYLFQHHQFSPKDMRILNLGTEFSDQALIDMIIFNIINHSWKDWDELKEVLIPIFRLMDYAKFVNIVIFTLRLRCCQNHQQFEEKFDLYQIIGLYIEIMFEMNSKLIKQFKSENYRKSNAYLWSDYQ